MDKELKQKIIEKYSLYYENGKWYAMGDNFHKQLVFKDSFIERNDTIGVLFRINKLCLGKVKYFRNNIEKYSFYKYDYKKGFIETELWDAEFLKHKASGFLIDFRFLQSITVYNDFIKLYMELESYET